MPIFDFQCEECGNKFDLMLSNRDKNKAKCPKCDSAQIKQLLSMFATTSSSPNCSDSCGYMPSRPGCCASGGCGCGLAH